MFVVSGTFILLFGWMGFNPGSTLGATDLRISVVAINTNLAAVAGSAAAMLLWYFIFGKPDITMACNGMLAGLVAITAPCAFVSPTSAVVIGMLAGVVVCLGCCSTSGKQDRRPLRRDFGARILRIFRGGGVGIFADGTYGAGWNGVGAASYLGKAGQGVTGLIHGDLSQFWTQLGGATLMVVYAFGLTFGVFSMVNKVRSMRVSKEVGLIGLDVPEFGMLAYPEDAVEMLATGSQAHPEEPRRKLSVLSARRGLGAGGGRSRLREDGDERHGEKKHQHWIDWQPVTRQGQRQIEGPRVDTGNTATGRA